MGKARIRMSWELVQQFLQLPTEWKPSTVYLHQTGYNYEPTYEPNIIVESENIEDKDTPMDLVGHFNQKTFDDKDGRWVQGHWELFR